ncbi:hypothetical protein SAMN05444392_102384 [Seinonella peptonophila]|uniref:Uncharacterized protein n=1 Tax=Seinonella peptonophila TaxID=112248 RepID=A0A1M4VIR4_9BACL|nr:hypothetical protein [Seinonella peptonophila]SHE68869.1 hypothetical protein SAMN05444392_102384 [Seinonella peptonophila]
MKTQLMKGKGSYNWVEEGEIVESIFRCGASEEVIGKAPFRAQLSGMAAEAAFSFRANCSSLRRRMPEEASFAQPRKLTERGQFCILARPSRSIAENHDHERLITQLCLQAEALIYL